MAMTTYELAQVNIGRRKYALDAPEMKDFTDNLSPVNAVAEGFDGFVWRFRDETADNATEQRIFGDDQLLVNMSVWRDTAALTAFMYQGTHRELLSRRFEFFERVQEAMAALWWVPSGHRPTIADAEHRLTLLRTHGPTPDAFTLRTSFPPPTA
ncbi:DUF3291 domain-containing protein [Streptomyces clavuligerus]|uniref:DUF3291 domain-containing protein n=1 Tax=Streptomyces clavuligerus TaxID=1901 RepID=E2Q5L4_STRCL|nr:DUF3291 domain-containing protein [Streptomyces clavuligerus]ANW18173.1 hypothetical protein BB341_08000 [Streptomyces clavuligerus]AXU12733.1 DUF3291 domain-containing protein [Streptomyces clavuligerus]EFG09228.1 Hypothetical protein SCLAV_4153 [Streptomyces clavuligerus]MBY6302639.1 DUF3291 domain-containing protein [Streptomyces clavuligerus]QCS05517.1 DUF3291 domain-containing protein [Streptomyces clavuligerus]